MKPLILVVDDHHDIRMSVCEMIQQAGYATLDAAQASDALLLLERHPTIVLLVTDIMMPGLNGFVLADMAVARWPYLRVIYASGATDLRDADAQPGQHHGMILAKPLRAEQLSTAIRMTLSRPFLSGEAMWGQGLARVTRIAPIGGKTNREVDLVHRV